MNKAYVIKIKIHNLTHCVYVSEDEYKHEYEFGGSNVWATSYIEYAKLFRFKETTIKKAQEIYSWFTGYKADEQKIEIISFNLSDEKEEVEIEKSYIGQAYGEPKYSKRTLKRAAKRAAQQQESE